MMCHVQSENEVAEPTAKPAAHSSRIFSGSRSDSWALGAELQGPWPYTMTEMDGVIREHEVYFATLAEQAERYDEMAEHMKSAALFEQELDAEERNLLAVAFKQAVGQRRCAWRIVCAAEQEEQAKGNHMTTASARGYRKKIEAELTSLCQTILALLTDKLIPGATTAEAKVSYYKAQGDYYRYMAEINDDMDRTRATTAAKAAYEDGTKVAETSLKVTSPFRLGLALNHAVFYYEARSYQDKTNEYK